MPYDYIVEMTNRIKRLDLEGRVPEELWSEVRNTVQEAVAKTIRMKKKCKKADNQSEEALQIAEKREGKEKGKAMPNWMQSSHEQQGERRKSS